MEDETKRREYVDNDLIEQRTKVNYQNAEIVRLNNELRKCGVGWF